MSYDGEWLRVSKRVLFEITLKKDDFADLTIKKYMPAGMSHGISRLRLSLR
jgi:hypothetical protein